MPILVLDSKEVRRGSFTMDSYRSLIRYSIIRHIKALLLISCFLGRSFVFPYLPYILYKKLCKKSKKTATRRPCIISVWRDVWDNPEGVLLQHGGRISYGMWIYFWMTVAMIVIGTWLWQPIFIEQHNICHTRTLSSLYIRQPTLPSRFHSQGAKREASPQWRDSLHPPPAPCQSEPHQDIAPGTIS